MVARPRSYPIIHSGMGWDEAQRLAREGWEGELDGMVVKDLLTMLIYSCCLSSSFEMLCCNVLLWT